MSFSNSKLKSAGSWYRTNKWLRSLRESGSNSDFIQAMKDDPELTTIATTMRGIMADESGVTSQQFEAAMGAQGLPGSADDQLSQWLDVGFPFTVYMGELQHPHMTRVEPGGAYPPAYPGADGNNKTNTKTTAVYVPTNLPYWRQAAEQLRGKLAGFRSVERKLEDFANVHADRHINPGGRADATQEA